MGQIRKVGFVLVLLVLAGCQSIIPGDNFQNLEPGMTTSQVETIAGPPNTFRVAGNQEVWTYLNKLISGWSWDRVDFHVIFTNGRVTEVGAGEVRQDPSFRLFIYTGGF